MSYIGKWVFHSIGAINQNDELVFMNAEEYLKSPMPYIDESDPEAIADELKERKLTIGSKLAVCPDGKLYMLAPLPEGVTQDEVDAAVASGELQLYDGMLTDRPINWEERNGALWIEVGTGMSESGWEQLSDDNGFLVFMTTRFIKSE